ncbi:MAG: leucyl aminopeptidase [Chlamydiales bacterium]
MFTILPKLASRHDAELIVLPFWMKPKKAEAAASLGTLKDAVMSPIAAKDFKGEKGEKAVVYLSKEKEPRALLLGLGKQEKVCVETLRRSYSEAVKFCQEKGIEKINVVLPDITEMRKVSARETIEGVCEGILLTNYKWEQLVTLDEETVLLKEVTLIGALEKDLAFVKRLESIAEGVYLSRDLTNGNADDVTPQYLASVAKKMEQEFPSIHTTIFDKKRIEKEKLGLLLAVGRGSDHDPAFIIMSHKGAPRSKEHIVIVGKGVTFDTGGLNLKPTGSMETMRDDMSGSSVALSTVTTAAALGLPLNVTAVVPSAENCIDGKSFKPGDVYRCYNGTTVEIGNTDAEGRLLLADALAYAAKNLKPTCMIDVATLTGSIVVALGDDIAGLFCNQDKLANELLHASKRVAETLWRMPLHEAYDSKLKSDIADIKNIGGRPAGSITAALFLQRFVGDIPWAHLDIAGTAFLSKENGYWPKNGVGFGVRLLIDFLSHKKNS